MSGFSLQRLAGRVRDASAWRPSHCALAVRQLVGRRRNERAGYTDRDHLLAAAEWLERAQDATRDGGVCGRYRLRTGWTSSYPETTGYIIPTFLALASELRADRFRDRARRCVEFLLSVQLETGAFPGGEIHENRTRPSSFNTAQVISGLTAWHAATGDGRALAAAVRAADWLASLQETDGAWRQHVYRNVATTYFAYATGWLAELGRHTGSRRYLDAAGKHLDWVLRHQDPDTGWFDLSGFDVSHHRARRAVTHTIAYTLQGLLATSEILGRRDGIDAVHRAARGIARRLELSRWLPGVLDSAWRTQADYACLTGCAQMALVWLRLYELREDSRLLNAALKALDLVKAAQPMTGRNPAVRGGVPGSDPIWGEYLYMAFPNWAVKFFIDALLAKNAVSSGLPIRRRGRWRVPADVPTSLPVVPAGRPIEPLRIVFLASPYSMKVPQMVRAWRAWGFGVAAVVVERRPGLTAVARLQRRLADDGLRALTARLLPGNDRVKGPVADSLGLPRRSRSVRSFCVEENIPVLEVGPLDSDEAAAAIGSLRPDLAIYAGAGILRAPILRIPRLGTLNAHMGLLPQYRGMNVAEWARFHGDPVGCSVHLIDPGIDTGDILCVRAVDTRRARSIRELRDIVDEAQIALLGEVVRWILATGELPPRRPQRPDEGLQFFRMHAAIAAVLEAELSAEAAGA